MNESGLGKRKAGDGDDVGAVTSKLNDQVEMILAEARKEAKEMKEAAIEEIAKWQEEKKDIQKTRTFDAIITLNVGGTHMMTTLSTLTSVPNSTLGKMFSGRHDLPKDKDGAYFIDRSPVPFAEILEFLRSPKEYCMEGFDEKLLHKVQVEAKFLGVEKLLFTPAAPTTVLSIPDAASHKKQKQYDVTITQDLKKVWYMAGDAFGGKDIVYQAHMCKYGCGYACIPKYTHVGVENFAATRKISAKQPIMKAGSVCAQCHQPQ